MNRRKFIIGTTITGTCLLAFQQLQGFYQLARPKFQYVTVHKNRFQEK